MAKISVFPSSDAAREGVASVPMGKNATLAARADLSSAPMAALFPIGFVRSQFPALAGEWTFLDNAGGSQILSRVVDRVVDFWRTSNVQVGATYAPSALAAERVHQARRHVAALFGAKDDRGVVLGASTTQLLQNLAQAMAPSFAPGDEIIVTTADHESNIGPWQRLESRGVVVKEWRVDETSWRLELSDLAKLMTNRTRLVCFTHCSNLLGTIQPVAEITRFVHDHGARVCVDGVAYAPHRALHVDAWEVDYYVFSLYKVYGPHMAALYGRPAHLEALTGINHVFIHESPYKLQPGNVCFELAHGLGGIGDYIGELGRTVNADPFDAIAQHEEALAERLLAFLRAKSNVRILGKTSADRAERVPTIAFSIAGTRASAIPPHADAAKIGIRFGDFYARRLVTQLGLLASDGVVRVSLVHYNTIDEIDRLISVLDRAL